jgi:hypothetical protein
MEDRAMAWQRASTNAIVSVEARQGRRLQGTGAVVAGLLVNVILGTVTDAVLHGTGIFPPAGEPMAAHLWLLAIAYRTLFGVAGCYLTARLAPDRPLRHALVLGGVGLVLSVLGTVAVLGEGPEYGPLWYALGVIAIVMPSAWLGGTLGASQLRAGAIGRAEGLRSR